MRHRDSPEPLGVRLPRLYLTVLWPRYLKDAAASTRAGRSRNRGRRPARPEPRSSRRSDRQPREPLPAVPDATLTCGRPTKAGEDTKEKDRWRLPPRKWLWERSPKSSQHRSQGLRRERPPVRSGGGAAYLRRAQAPELRSECAGTRQRAESASGTGTGGGDPEVGGGGPARGCGLRQGRSQPRKVPAPGRLAGVSSQGGSSGGAGFSPSRPHSPRCSALARPRGAGERTAATAAVAAAAGAAPPGGAGPGAGSRGRPRGREAGGGPPLAPEPGGAGPGRSHARLLLGTPPPLAPPVSLRRLGRDLGPEAFSPAT